MPISQVDTLTDAQVEEMLADEEKLNSFVNSLPYIQDYMLRKGEADRLQGEVDDLTKRCGANPELEARRTELDKKRTEFQEKSEQKRRKECELTQAALYEKLDAAAKAIDVECDEIVSQFLDGEMEAKDFAKAYKEKRVVYHSRSAKKESIAHSM